PLAVWHGDQRRPLGLDLVGRFERNRLGGKPGRSRYCDQVAEEADDQKFRAQVLTHGSSFIGAPVVCGCRMLNCTLVRASILKDRASARRSPFLASVF